MIVTQIHVVELNIQLIGFNCHFQFMVDGEIGGPGRRTENVVNRVAMEHRDTTKPGLV